MSDTFNPGQRVYLSDGTEAYYVVAAPGAGHVISLMIDEGHDPEDGPLGGQCTLVVPVVWAKPPVAEKAAEVADLEARVKALKDEERAIRNNIRAEQKAADERRAALAKWAEFERLEDFLAGRITHVVRQGYGAPDILTLTAALKVVNEYGRETGLRLVSLFGNSKGNLQYRLNQYGDGSGSSVTIHPARSEDEAREIAARLWDAAMADFRSKDGYMHGFNYWVEAAPRLGIEIPTDLAERWRQSSLSTWRDALARSEAEAAAHRARIEALEAEQVSA